MIVNLIENYQVRITQHNHILEVYEDSKPTDNLKAIDGMTKAGWNVVGYFGTMQQILRGVMKHSLEVSNEVLTLDEYVDKIDALVEQLGET